MSAKSFRTLLVVVVGLVLVTWGLELARDRGSADGGRLLVPGLADDAGTANEITISVAAADDVVLRRDDDRWTVASRDGYAADVAQLRQLVLALSEASIVEDKTSDPARYARLGVAEPGEDGGGSRIVIAGEGFSHEVILGDSAQGDYRYARVPGDATSYLVDRNPELPQSSGDWLLPDIIDIGSDRVHRVTITHADGETIVIDKTARDLTDFTVLDVPPGRELSYASVGNGVAGALGKLTLDDVRARTDAEPTTTTEFLTWDGLRVTASVVGGDDDRWVTFDVEQYEAPPAAEPAGQEPEADDAAADGPEPAAAPPPAADAATLRATLTGWEYRLPDYKTGLLVRRWDELLKAATGE